jgi:hypothetical protein
MTGIIRSSTITAAFMEFTEMPGATVRPHVRTRHSDPV